METIRTRTHVENGHVTVDVPAHWNDKDIEVVLVAHDAVDPMIGEGSYVMAHVKFILAQGGCVWPVDVMEWQRAERQDRPMPGRE